jgi:hypothetical protein
MGRFQHILSTFLTKPKQYARFGGEYENYPCRLFSSKMSFIVEKFPQTNIILLQAEHNIMKGNNYTAVTVHLQKGYLNLKPSVTLDLDEKMLHTIVARATILVEI